jgi:hypothetical protein
MLIATYLAPSSIHGIGVFAGQSVARNTRIWQYDPRVDLLVDQTLFAQLPQVAREYLTKYAYRWKKFPGMLVLNGDNAKFINHSANPNSDNSTDFAVAKIDILQGQEITCNYYEVEDGDDFAPSEIV